MLSMYRLVSILQLFIIPSLLPACTRAAQYSFEPWLSPLFQNTDSSVPSPTPDPNLADLHIGAFPREISNINTYPIAIVPLCWIFNLPGITSPSFSQEQMMNIFSINSSTLVWGIPASQITMYLPTSSNPLYQSVCAYVRKVNRKDSNFSRKSQTDTIEETVNAVKAKANSIGVVPLWYAVDINQPCITMKMNTLTGREVLVRPIVTSNTLDAYDITGVDVVVPRTTKNPEAYPFVGLLTITVNPNYKDWGNLFPRVLDSPMFVDLNFAGGQTLPMSQRMRVLSVLRERNLLEMDVLPLLSVSTLLTTVSSLSYQMYTEDRLKFILVSNSTISLNPKGQILLDSQDLPLGSFYLSVITYSYSKITLSECVLAQIFYGQITTWDDMAIRKDNPNVNFQPNATIVVIAPQSDTSFGAIVTYGMTQIMSKCGLKSTNLIWKGSVRTLRESVELVERTPFSIGFGRYGSNTFSQAIRLKSFAGVEYDMTTQRLEALTVTVPAQLPLTYPLAKYFSSQSQVYPFMSLITLRINTTDPADLPVFEAFVKWIHLSPSATTLLQGSNISRFSDSMYSLIEKIAGRAGEGSQSSEFEVWQIIVIVLVGCILVLFVLFWLWVRRNRVEEIDPNKDDFLDPVDTDLNIPERRLAFVIHEASRHQKKSLVQFLWSHSHSVIASTHIDKVRQAIEREMNHVVLLDVDSPVGNVHRAEIEDRCKTLDIMFVASSIAPAMISPPTQYVLSKPFVEADIQLIITEATKKVVEQEKRHQELLKLRQVFNAHNSADWEKLECIGTGSFGEVYRARCVITGGIMAVKMIPLETNSKALTDTLSNEIDILRTMDHRNVTHYFYCERGDDTLNLFMEYAPGGSLAKLIQNRHEFMSFEQIARIMKEVVSAVAYIHELGIVHRDIKAANVLLGQGEVAKLSDFGCASRLDDKGETTGVAGSIRWMAPEMPSKKPYGTEVDIWSLGCLMIELLTGKAPFSDKSTLELHSWLTKLPVGTSAPHGCVNVSNKCDEFLRACLQVTPEWRPQAFQLLEFEYLHDMTPNQSSVSTLSDQCSVSDITESTG
eukprot:PhF_6_TR36540/c0_g1_i1/m.53888/K11228/STE11; mitogen-activated protein kinase kinase kinase